MKELGKHITRNLYGFYRRTAELCGYETGHIGGLEYVWNRSGSWPSYVLGVPEPSKIPEIMNAIRQGKVPPFWILEQTGGEEIRLLEEAGVRVIREWKGMAMEKHAAVPVGRNHDFGIRTNDPDTMNDWLQIVNTELMTGAQISDGFLNRISSSVAFQWKVAYMDDQATGAGLSFAEDGVAGVYMIVTKASFRGRGIGTQVTRNLIDHAIRSGNDTIVLHATGQGERIYRKTGFSEVNRFSVMWYMGQ
ncbi:MAG: GNAT family N-acetyltransferase [Bacteroidales bacterium]|nr:GNAT family N-acetyltransferase [Bacteroidales bacterium]